MRRYVAGVVAGGVYVVLVRLAFALLGRMRHQAALEFSSPPLVFGTIALLGVGAITAVAVVSSRRLPALPWTAGILLFVSTPMWLVLPWAPAPFALWLSSAAFGTTPVLAGLMLAVAIHVTWFVERTPAPPRKPVEERVITAE